MVTNFFTVWPLLMTLLGGRLAWLLLRRPKPKDRHWWVWLFLTLSILHHFEEAEWDVLGRPYSIVEFVCGKLGFVRAEVALCPADYPYFFSLHLVDTWLLTIAAISMSERRVLAGATAIAVPFVDGLLHVLFTFSRPHYSPGLVTALFVILPTGWMYFRTALEKQWLSIYVLAGALLAGVLAQVLIWGPLILASMGELSQTALLWTLLTVALLPLGSQALPRSPLVKTFTSKGV